MTTKQLLRFGLLTPIVLWITILSCGYILGYSHITRFVSELGAVGTSTQSLFTGGIMLCSILNLAFFLGLYNACRELGLNPVPTYIIATFSLSMFGVSLFPTPQFLHGMFGMITMLMHVAPLLVFILWREQEKLARLRVFSLVLFIVLAVQGAIPFIPGLLKDYQGLVARFFHLGWSVWYVLLSYRFVKLVEEKDAVKEQLVVV